MAIFVITLFAILLTILPLQWQLPFDLLGLFTREPWNGPSIVLHSVSAFFYLVVFIQRKKWLVPAVVQNCFAATAFLILWWLFAGASPAASMEVARLLGIIWVIPLISFVHQRLGTPRLLFLLVAVAAIHAQWGIVHFINQDDLGLYIIGETRLDVAAAGIAKFTLGNPDHNQKVLRGYGPYPHPNSLGGALTLGFMASLALVLRKNAIAPAILSGFILVALLVTFSRSALLAAAIAGGIFLYYRKTSQVKPKILWGSLVFVAVTSLVFTPFWINRLIDAQDVATAQRLLGTTAAWRLVQANPWFGVGIGEYTQALERFFTQHHWAYAPWQVAPVHSVPLLIAAQVGLVGAVVLLLGLTYYGRQLRRRQTWWALPLLPLLLFDHYLLTQVAPLVMLLVWLYLLPRLVLSAHQHSLGVTQSTDS